MHYKRKEEQLMTFKEVISQLELKNTSSGLQKNQNTLQFKE